MDMKFIADCTASNSKAENGIRSDEIQLYRISYRNISIRLKDFLNNLKVFNTYLNKNFTSG